MIDASQSTRRRTRRPWSYCGVSVCRNLLGRILSVEDHKVLVRPFCGRKADGGRHVARLSEATRVAPSPGGDRLVRSLLMCLLIVICGVVPGMPLIVAANRDERRAARRSR